MTTEEAFRLGYLERCLADGLTPEQIAGSIKVAVDLLEKRAVLGAMFNAAGNVASSLGSKAVGLGVPLALAAPPVVGGLLGYAAAKGTDWDDTDVQEVKNQELVEEYRRQVERMQQERAARNYAKDNRRPGRAFI
jgi:hypothetical protein